MGQDDLRQVLKNLPGGTPGGNLLVGNTTSDDSAVLRIDERRAIVQTVDFFTPIVDDPELFGAIAAANSVSDIYAMGAEPILGLAIAAFPTDKLPLEILEAILRGGATKAAEAGFPIAGGHTIIDEVPKYGIAVTGIVDIDKVILNSTARSGDALYLTKPIGNGIIISSYRAWTTSSKPRFMRHSPPDIDEATKWMTHLNRDAARAMQQVGVSAATDVTGYGLIGHLLEICENSGVGAEIQMESVPLLAGVRELLARGFFPDGSTRNTTTFRAKVSSSVPEDGFKLLCDAQTSGGLLVAISPEKASALENAFTSASVFFARIGSFTDRAGLIELKR